MQFQAALVALFAVAATAQDLTGLPACAQPCFKDNFPSSGCQNQNDYACLCQSTKYIDDVTGCVAQKCTTEADIRTARKWAEDKCKAAGHPI